MDIIKTYLDNVFASLPKTKEVLKMKEDLFNNMEDKYHELKRDGKSENEAVGIVISEFGNIEELASELNIDISVEEEKSTYVTEEIAVDYIDATKKHGKLIGLGVLLDILCPVPLILLDQIIGTNVADIIGVSVLLIFVAISVGIFIYSGMSLKEYDYLKENVILSVGARELLKKEKKQFHAKFTFGLIISVVLFILSPVAFIVLAAIQEESGLDKYATSFGFISLFAMVAVGVFTIIRLAIPNDGYNALLKLESYSARQTKSNKTIDTIAGIYWPIVTVAYLLWSFLGDSWEISWLIWVVAGIVFGAISSIVQATSKNENERGKK